MTASPTDQLVDLLLDVDKPKPPGLDEPIRFGRLKKMAASAAHYAFAPEYETSSMDVGSAAHSLILGGKRVTAYPGKVRNGKEWDKFAADNRDAMILTKRELAKATGIAEAVKADADAMRVLEGVREQTMIWKQNGRLCRGTPDVRGDGFITELKTGETSDPRAFPWKVKRFSYHAQLAWYTDGALLSGLDEAQAHYVVAVEATQPHVVTVFRLTPQTIEKGRRLVRLWFERLQQCEASNQWPAYVQSVVELDLPDDDFGEMVDAIEPTTDAPF